MDLKEEMTKQMCYRHVTPYLIGVDFHFDFVKNNSIAGYVETNMNNS